MAAAGGQVSPGRLRGAVVAVTAIAVTAAVAGPAQAAAPVGGPTSQRAWVAKLVVPTTVRLAPRASARGIARLATTATWNGGQVRLLVLASRRDAGGRRWLRVELAERPNGRSGWIDADVVRLGVQRWRVEINVHARRGRAYRDGRLMRTWRVVVGKSSTPTPRGLFAVYERVRQPSWSELGPYALHLTAHSNVLLNYGGGRGRVALHGRSGPLLGDPLGSASSHGCVRMNNGVIRWLAARAGPGTPVRIR